MTRSTGRTGLLVVSSGLLALALTACGSGGSKPAAAPTPSVAATTPSTAGAGVIAPSSTASPTTTASPASPTLTAAEVADHGLPSKVGPGKLSTATIKKLAQYFEDKVNHAYATGDANALDHYLAGPMLSGNRATINLLASQKKRNVVRIEVQTISTETNETDHLIFDMTGDMTLNYFFNPTTKKVLDNGLPGPSQVQFVMFFDRNPKTHTWYWTGEKADTGDSATSGSDGTTG